MPRESNTFVRALEIVESSLDGRAGNITLAFREDGEVGLVKLTEDIVIQHPTNFRIVEAVREIYRKGFRGNVIMPRGATSDGSFVIVKESFYNPRFMRVLHPEAKRD